MTSSGIEGRNRRDKLLEVYLNKSLFRQRSDKFQLLPESEIIDLQVRRKERQMIVPARKVSAQGEVDKQPQLKTQEELVTYIKDYFKNYHLSRVDLRKRQNIILKSVKTSL